MSRYDQYTYPEIEHLNYERDQAAQLIAERLLASNGTPRIGIDLDGVLLTGYGDQADVIIHPDTIQTLIDLDQRSDISLITTRNASALQLIQSVTDGHVDLTGGIHSFDKGCTRYDGSLENPFYAMVPPEYMNMLKVLDQKLDRGPYAFEPTWADVASSADDWCKGDPRWQSTYMRSIWYRYSDRYGKGSPLIFFTHMAQKAAHETNAQIMISHFSQPKKNLAWSKVYPRDISKAHPFLKDEESLQNVPDIYINDGANGELETIHRFRQSGQYCPLIITIGESPDEHNDEMQWCRDNADIQIPTVDEMYQVMNMVLPQIPIKRGS